MPQTVDYEFVVCEHCGRRFGAITVRHLRNLHGYEGEHPIADYKARFGLETATSRAARDKLTDTKIDFWKQRVRQEQTAELGCSPHWWRECPAVISPTSGRSKAGNI